MNVNVFLPNNIDFTVMRPKLKQFEANCIESANILLKIQQAAGLYPEDLKAFYK